MTTYADSSGNTKVGTKLSSSNKHIITTAKINKTTSLTNSPGKGSKKSNSSVRSDSETSTIRSAGCNLFPPKHPGLSNTQSPELRKLAQYEQLCNGALADRSATFVPTPTTVTSAKSDASEVATKLKEYSSFGIKPLVFFEPNDTNGNNLDLNQYMSGTYDSALDSFFSNLKNDGLTDSMMGNWVLLPEGNIPVWSTTDSGTFVADVTKTAQFQKKYFPNSQTSIMLDSESYAPGSSWGSGAYVSLLPYVLGIPKGLIDTFGIQGFPWVSAANQGTNKYYDPSVYLRSDLAAQAARTLGVNNIWFNTGTFNQMYTNNASQIVTASSWERQSMINGVIAQAKTLKAQGFTVEVHIFAQDKSSISEAIDWSYWKGQPGSDSNTLVFTKLVHDLKISNIPLWLFDTYDN